MKSKTLLCCVAALAADFAGLACGDSKSVALETPEETPDGSAGSTSPTTPGDAAEGSPATESKDASSDSKSSDAASASTDDPFVAASCTGTPLTVGKAATAMIGAGETSRIIASAKKLIARTRSCNETTGCGPWSANAPASNVYLMADGGDNGVLPRHYDVQLAMHASGATIHVTVEDISYRAECPKCTPAGITLDLGTSELVASSGNVGLPFYVTRWAHGSSGFHLDRMYESESFGPAATAAMTVTDHCTRATVLSKDKTTEYGVVFQY